MKVWHFLREDRKLRDNDNRVVEAGSILTIERTPILYEKCLYGRIKPLDALFYAPGPVVCRMDIRDRAVQGADCKCLWMYNASDVLRKFARLCALSVIHMWDAPEIVVRYLKTGDESIRGVARDEILSACHSAAKLNNVGFQIIALDAAGAAVRDAPESAAWGASCNAAQCTRSGVHNITDVKQNRELHRMLMKGRPHEKLGR